MLVSQDTTSQIAEEVALAQLRIKARLHSVLKKLALELVFEGAQL